MTFKKLRIFHKLLTFHKIHLPIFLLRLSLRSVMKRPRDSNTSTTSGQKNGQTSTTSE